MSTVYLKYFRILNQKFKTPLIVILLFLVVGLTFQWYTTKVLSDSKTYSIGTIDTIKAGGIGCAVLCVSSFTFKGKKITSRDCLDSSNGNQAKTGSRFFCKINSGNPNLSFEPYFDHPVPDSLRSSPDNGFTEDWIREHFPDVLNHKISEP